MVLGIIIVNTELAADDIPERNPAKECIEEIRKASMRATDVVMQLLSFARKSLIEKKPTPITHIVKETLKLVRASIPTTIEITQNLSCESDTVLADPTQISQVLINLCTNAKDAMAEEGGILKVSLANEELGMRNVKLNLAPGKYVKLSISDTGRGIEPEIIDSIFEPFFTTKGRNEGTGMGLSVAHGIVKSYGGDISVKSEIGKGSVFEMLLPCVEADMQAQTETGMKKFPWGNERILVVDDEEGLVRAYTITLKSLGYDVISCTSAEEALKIYRERHDEIDLVITDMTMPVMPGGQTGPGTDKIPA